MKFKLVVAGALVAASLSIAVPASALTKATDGNIVCQIPPSYDSYLVQQFDETGAFVDSFTGGVDTNFSEPYPFVAVDNNSNLLYLLSTGTLLLDRPHCRR